VKEEVAIADEVTSLIQGASRLLDVYGYWITFHDAVVEAVIIERIGPTVTIHFKTNDAPSQDGGRSFQYGDSRLARVLMRWSEVRDLTLTGVDWEENNWIGGLKFELERDSIRTTVERMDGPHGVILAERVEVVSVKPIEEAAEGASGTDALAEMRADMDGVPAEDRSPMVVQLRLAAQRALLGAVTPNLRGVTVGWESGATRLRFYFDGPISAEDEAQARHVGAVLVTDYWYGSPGALQEEVLRLDAPQPMERLAAWAYLRKETDL
jgi:hypothetical protein